MIELETYSLECPDCKREIEFTVKDIDGLASDIEDAVEDACKTERRDAEREYEGMVDPDDLPILPQTMKELAAAIRRGDMPEAELLLDRVADDLGSEHTNAVQIGRYTPDMTRAS